MNYDNIPNDPVILLSFINTQLRDNYESINDFCHAFDENKENIISKLSSIDYTYDISTNQFI